MSAGEVPTRLWVTGHVRTDGPDPAGTGDGAGGVLARETRGRGVTDVKRADGRGPVSS